MRKFLEAQVSSIPTNRASIESDQQKGRRNTGQEPRTRLAALKVLGRWHKESAKGRTTSKEGQDQESKEGKGNSLSRAVVDRAVLRTVGLRLLDKHPVVRGEAYLFAGKLGLPCRMQLLAPLLG